MDVDYFVYNCSFDAAIRKAMEQEAIDGDYNIDLKQVANHKQLFAVTKLLASTMMSNPYIHPGYFIRDLSDNDLTSLIDLSTPDHPDFENLMLIAMMLTTGEGIAITDQQVHRSINALITILVCESLRRKQLVKVHHQNFSFGEDAGSNLVVERIEGLDYRKLAGELGDE